MIKLNDLVIGRGVQILRGRYAGRTGTIANFKFDNTGQLEDDQIDVKIDGERITRYLGQDDIKLVDPWQTLFKSMKENKIKRNDMAKLVAESLEELFESKKVKAKKKEEKEDNAKPENIKKVHAKVEKTKAIKLKNQSKIEKYNQAIKGLKDQLAKAKKLGAFKTTAEKNAKIKDLNDKIKSWEKKKENEKLCPRCKNIVDGPDHNCNICGGTGFVEK